MYLLSIINSLSLRVYKISAKLGHKIKWKNKVRRLIKIKGSKKLTNSQKQEIKSYFSKLDLHNISTNWHRYYFSCNGYFSPYYVPEDLFYMELEPGLNRSTFVGALADKNLLDSLFPEVRQPATILKNSNGFYYRGDELITKEDALKQGETDKEMVIKPTLETGGGKNVVVFKCSNGITNWKNYSLTKLLSDYKKDFIVQELVHQHPLMKQLNESSLNTFRVMSFLKGCNIEILSVIVRMGREGSRTDNSTTGGLSCGVNRDGSLKDMGFHNNSGNSYTETDSGIKFKDIKLPFIDKIDKTISYLHKEVPYFRLISWDLAIDPDSEVVLIEYNIYGQDINFHQLNNGPVLKTVIMDWSKKKLISEPSNP